MLENKSGNISETRKDRGKLLWTTYRNSQTLFRTVPSPIPYGLPFLEIGGLQLSYPLSSQEQVKLRTSNLAGTWADPNKSPLKFWRKRSVGVSRDCPNFVGTPYIISGTGKATDFKFGGYIYRAYPNKSPLKIFRKRSVGVSRDCPIFLGTPYYLSNG